MLKASRKKPHRSRRRLRIFRYKRKRRRRIKTYNPLKSRKFPLRTKKKICSFGDPIYSVVRRKKFRFRILKFKAPFYKDYEESLFHSYKTEVFDNPKRRRPWMIKLRQILVRKDMTLIVEVHIGISGSNAFLTVRIGYIKEKKIKPLKRQKKKKSLSTLKRKRGFARMLQGQCKTQVIYKITPPLVGYGGIKKSTDYAKQQLFVFGGKFINKLEALFIRLRIKYGNARAFRRRKVYRPLTRRFNGFVLSFESVQRRPHGFLRGKKKKRL